MFFRFDLNFHKTQNVYIFQFSNFPFLDKCTRELYPKNTKLNDRDEAVYIGKMLATRRHGVAGE